MSLRRLRAVFQKELRHIVRDVRSLIMALAVPLVLLLLFGYALSLDVDRIPTLVYDADGSPRSRELVERFDASRFFEIRGSVDNYAAIEREIDSSRVMLGIVIPRDYSARIAAGREAEVQLLLDGSDSNTASIAKSYAESVVGAHSSGLKAGRSRPAPVEARTRVWYNSTLESRNYIVPGLIAVILMIIAALLTSLTIAREWEMGTMEQLLSTPVRPAEIVLGKMLGFFVLGVADTVIAVVVGIWVFGVPFRGSALLLAGAGCVFLCGALFWGILVSAWARNQVMAYQIGILSSFLPAFLLSGFVYATANMPGVIQVVSYLFPARYFVTMLKGIFLKGVGLEVLWLEALLLVAYSVAIFALATRRLSQKMV